MANILEVILNVIDNLAPTLESDIDIVNSFESAIDSASSSIDNINTAQFESVEQAANSAGLSVEQVGEAASMAGYDISSIDPSPLNETSSGAQDAAGAGDEMATSFSAVEGVFGALVGVGIGAFFDEIIDKATGSVDAWNLLGAALDSQGVSMDSAKSEIISLADEHGFLTKNVREAEKILVQAGASYEEVTKSGGDMNAAMAISVATGQDLTNSATQLQRAYMGNGRALKLLGIDVNDYKDASTGMVNREALNAAIIAKLGGQLDEYGDSYEAMSTRAENAISKLETSLGKLLLPAFTNVTEAVIGAIDAFMSLPAPIQQIIDTVSLTILAIVALTATISGLNKLLGIDLVYSILKASSQLMLFALTPTGAAVIALAALAAILIYAGTQYGWFSTAVENANNALAQGKQAVDNAKQAQSAAQTEVDKWTTAVNNATPGTENYTTATNNLQTAKNNLATATTNAKNAEDQYNGANATHQTVMANYAAAVENARKQVIAYKVAIGEMTPEQGAAANSQAEWASGLSESDQQIQTTTDNLNNQFNPAMAQTASEASKNPFHAFLGSFADLNLNLNSATNAWDYFKQLFNTPITTDPTYSIREALRGVYCWIVGCSPGVIPAFQMLVAYIFGLPGQIAGGLGSILATVASWATGLINYATNAGSGFYNTILFYMLSLPGMVWAYLWSALSYIASFAGSAYNYALNAGNNIYQGVASGISGIASMVWSEMVSIGNAISSAGGTLYNTAVSLGQQIYQGLMAGLEKKSPGIMYKAIVEELGFMDEALQNNELPNSSKKLGEDISGSFNPSSSKNKSGSKSSSGVSELKITLIHDFENVPEGMDESTLLKTLQGLTRDSKFVDLFIRMLTKEGIITKLNLG